MSLTQTQLCPPTALACLARGRAAGQGWAELARPNVTSRLLPLMIVPRLWVSRGPVDPKLGSFLEPAPPALVHGDALLMCFGLWTLLWIQACLLSIT